MIPAAPAAQAVAVRAISEALGVAVSTRMPKTKPERFVIVSRIGGGDGPFGTAAPRFLIECYARTEFEAEEFAEIVRRTWKTLRSSQINYSYDDSNLTYYEAPDLDHYRFQFTGGLQLIL